MGVLLDRPTRFETYGAVKFFEVIRVLELDAVGARDAPGYALEPSVVEDYAARMAIVVPVKNDELLSLEGVIAAIPHLSPVIVVSASSRSPVDRFSHERDLAKVLYERTRRPILVVHQRDPAWREVLEGTPLSQLLDEDGLVRYGKGEGMILGVLAAAWLGVDYVGFIDSDNYVPGSAHEYALAYIAGFAMAESRRVMVRIKWPYKGKIPGVQGEVYLRKRGRVSAVTNRILNAAISKLRGVETEIIQTANSGEHALSLELGLSMEWAGGFAVEPYQLVSLLYYCWRDSGKERCPVLPGNGEVLQIETRNPHLHAERGDEHLASMLAVSLGTIYHSPLADEEVRKRIVEELRSYGYTGEPPKPRVYPPLSSVDARRLFGGFLARSMDALDLLD